jgi:hypothetical protein
LPAEPGRRRIVVALVAAEFSFCNCNLQSRGREFTEADVSVGPSRKVCEELRL